MQAPGPCGFLPGEHKSGDTCQPQAVRPGGPLRQHLVQLNPERQRGLAKATHLPRSRLASTPGHPAPSPESPLLGNSHCAHECPEKKKRERKWLDKNDLLGSKTGSFRPTLSLCFVLGCSHEEFLFTLKPVPASCWAPWPRTAQPGSHSRNHVWLSQSQGLVYVRQRGSR